MPHRMKASDAPNGLSVRIGRVAHGDRLLRVWRMWIDDPDPQAVRHDTVLVHGLGVSSQYFEKLAIRLARVGTVYLLDLPGFAGVPRPDRPLRIEDFADTVRWWLDRASLQAPALIGHSMGAQIVTETLAGAPTEVTHAVLIGPPVNAAERNPVLQAARLAQSSLFESSRTRRIALSGYLDCGPAWFARTLPGMLRYPIEERLAAVDVPVLVLHGQRDAVCPSGWVQQLAAAGPHVTSALVPKAAHAVIYDHGEQVVEHVLAHLATPGAGR